MNDFTNTTTPPKLRSGLEHFKTAELAAWLEIPVRTMQRYLSRHGRHVGAIKASSRGWQLAPNSLAMLVRVRDLYGSGSSAAEVEAVLEPPRTVHATRATSAPRFSESERDDAIEELQDRVQTLEDTVLELQDALETLGNERYDEKLELEMQTEAMETRFEELEEKISDLEACA